MAYFFILPDIARLTTEQRSVLNEPGPIAVSGGPGTGKSVVALWRHIRNHDTQARHSLLLTYTKSLELYLSNSAKTISEKAGETVNRTLYWTTHEANSDFEEIIIDEAQDVNIQKYHKIKSLVPMVSYSADNNQSLYSHGTTENELKDIFTNTSYRLRKNFRNSRQISQFIKSMFPDYLILTGEQEGTKPQLICTDGINDVQTEVILDIIGTYETESHNIAILLPLESHVKYWYNLIKENGFTCSKFSNSDEEISIIENIHITTFKSSKGLEFDSVIIPFFNQYEHFIQSLDVVEKNDYYVIFTRARTNLFLIDHSSTKEGNTQLKFIQLALEKDLIELDTSYLVSNKRVNAIVNDETDDLPF